MSNENYSLASEHEDIREQYKMIVNSYENGLQQRIGFNQSFVLLFTAIIGIYNFLMSREVPIPQTMVTYSVFFIGIVVGIFWMSIVIRGIKAEKNKFKMICEIESKMPMRVFTVPTKEDDVNKRKMFDPGYLELALPLFMVAVLVVNFGLFVVYVS
jgi:hypothetical protein